MLQPRILPLISAITVASGYKLRSASIIFSLIGDRERTTDSESESRA
ncbi:MAG: hypothetical protein QXN98_04005 [Candidatus Bathyarchaeia archaeon]